MKKIEKMISIKDASYIKDMFDWNIVAAKKYDEYLNNVEDEDIATLFNKCADMHYKILLPANIPLYFENTMQAESLSGPCEGQALHTEDLKGKVQYFLRSTQLMHTSHKVRFEYSYNADSRLH